METAAAPLDAPDLSGYHFPTAGLESCTKGNNPSLPLPSVTFACSPSAAIIESMQQITQYLDPSTACPFGAGAAGAAAGAPA